MVEQEDPQCTSPHEHTKNTSVCGEILTENKLETVRNTLLQTTTTKLQRRTHTKLGRRKGEAIRSGPVPLGGDTGKEGNIVQAGIISLGREGFKPHIRHLSVGSDTMKTILPPYTCQTGYYPKAKENKCWRQCVEKGNPEALLMGMYSHCGQPYGNSSKILNRTDI